MKKNPITRWLVLLTVLAMVLVACGDDATPDTTAAPGTDETTDPGGAGPASFTLFGAPTGVEGEALTGFVNVYNEATDSDITFRGSDGFEQELRIAVDGGDPPAVAFTPQPASICDFADDGHLVSLEDMGFDIAEMQDNHSAYWVGLGECADGQHYGIPWFPNFKSVVFYHQPTFEAQGYETPGTWDDMIALSQQIVDDGMTPWCFGFESGGATGWPGTDWIEDIFVRLHGAEAYEQWYNHEIPFNDPMVAEAFDTFGELFHAEGFVLGGAENVAGINFNDSPGPLFTDPPGCLMLKQGSFIANVFADQPAYTDGAEEDIGVFAFPDIDGNTGAMGGGDTLIVFDGSPEIVAALQDWISPTWQCTLASASGGGIAENGGHGVAGVERLPGHKDVDPGCYETESSTTFAEAITTALGENTFVFDASDLMPPEVGQRTFWDEIVEWSRGKDTQAALDAVEASWPSG
ncbi:ABC transporter substrate-binding protein [soil metagenome]